ncbi:MAG: hypothetical protein JO307_17800 [Bryobacterales bacterium]|nr:hypothetical protein [Bryobacterales bacterium]MBV9397084.1 hypothetical protein [Bryobacterales bacterium]
MDGGGARIGGNGRLEPVNVMLSPGDRSWLDQIAREMLDNGGEVSRSEIIRAALAAFRELHAIAPELLRGSRSGTDLELVGIAAIRSVTCIFSGLK